MTGINPCAGFKYTERMGLWQSGLTRLSDLGDLASLFWKR